MSKVLETINLFKTYRVGTENVQVLNDVNLEIEAGEFVSVMGPSGSGKSTLLYLTGGLDKPSKGTIKIMNEDISTMSDNKISLMRRKHLGFIFQFYNLIPNLNIVDNVMLPALLDRKKIKDYRKKAEELIEIVGLSDRKKHTPRELSGGQQQRVAIARALINEPELILADEPTGNLDSSSGEEIMKLLQKINKEKNKTIIMVTHSQEASHYSKRIINMKDGRVNII